MCKVVGFYGVNLMVVDGVGGGEVVLWLGMRWYGG